jgi:tetratricopeptide (TPR) repeat protein
MQQPLLPEFKAKLDQIRGELERTGIWERAQACRVTDAFQEGAFLVSRGRYLEGIPSLQAVVAQDSALAEPYYLLGVALVETGRAAEGLRSLERGLSLGLESADLCLYKGRAHLALKSFAEARRALNRALELNPQLGRARFFLAQVEAEAGHYDEAERLLAQALTQGLVEDESVMGGRAGLLIMAGKLRQADSLLAVALARYPNSANLRILSGEVAQRAGRLGEASRYRQEAGRIRPGGAPN